MRNRKLNKVILALSAALLLGSCAKQVTESSNQPPVFYVIPGQVARTADGQFAVVSLDSFVADETPALQLVWTVDAPSPFSVSVDDQQRLHVMFSAGYQGSQTVTLHVKDGDGAESSQSVRFSVVDMQAAERFSENGTMEIHRTVPAAANGELFYGTDPRDLNRHVRTIGNPRTDLVIPLRAVQSNTVYYYRWQAVTPAGDLLEVSPQDSFRTQTVTPPPMLRMTVIDVKQGDSEFLRTPSGKQVLIDGGYGTDEPSFGRSPGESWDGDAAPLTLNYLHAEQITHLDAILLTHDHADHYGGLHDVERSSSGISYDVSISPDDPHGLTVGGNWDIGDPLLSVKVFNLDYPEGVSQDNENNRSIVLKWTFGGISFLTTGDAEQPTESKIMQRFGGELNCEVLKVDHHGSSDGTTEQWIDAITPVYAAISCGAGNPYGHPHDECLKALNDHHVETLRTDVNGTVDFVTDGQTAIEAWY